MGSEILCQEISKRCQIAARTAKKISNDVQSARVGIASNDPQLVVKALNEIESLALGLDARSTLITFPRG